MTFPPVANLPGADAGGCDTAAQRMIATDSLARRHGAGRALLWPLAASSALVLVVAWVFTFAAAAQNGEEEPDGDDVEEQVTVPVALLDREPFFQLTLDAENGNAVLDVLPFETVPVAPKAGDTVRIRLVSEPDQEYEVAWAHIAKLRTYHQLVFEEAMGLVQQKKYNAAFRHFDYLLQHTTPTPALRAAVLEYLLENAGTLLAEQKVDHALVMLEEIIQRDVDFRAAEVSEKLSQAADALIRQAVERGDFAEARGVMTRLELRYGAGRMTALATWRQQLTERATQLKTQAEQKMAEGAWREAEQLSRRLAAIWPDLPGAQAMRQELARRYPMVIVGVSEAATHHDSISLDNWPARRTGRLTEKTLLEFNGAGPEGGQYLCEFGAFVQSDDRRHLTLELNPGVASETDVYLDGYTVARRLMEMADPASASYLATWAALVERVGVHDVFDVEIDLRRPHVLPEALLQIRLSPPTGQSSGPSIGPSPGDGPFQRVASDDADLHFVANPHQSFASDSHPREIVERYFETSDAALDALRRGEIDAVDFLFPDDAMRLAGDATLRVTPYALPTIHLLLPNHQKLFTANPTFRRALAYGIGRQAILNAEVLGNQQVPGCQLISGPFPIGTRDNDPLAYAYNTRIDPRPYDPRLATVLKTLARRELEEVAKKRGTEVPTETKLVLGFPGNQLARVTCQAVSQYLKVIGVECELRELPAGMSGDATGEMDLVYVQVAMWEPVSDARRLLAPTGVADGGNEYVGMALRRLDAARNWREARSRLHELHRIVAEQVAVIPLWQTVNYFAHRQRLGGVGTHPLTLYQDVEQWYVTSSDAQE
ncbi:MAG: ABC transporter substrate-binding protein [Pirellulaceae bacterium]